MNRKTVFYFKYFSSDESVRLKILVAKFLDRKGVIPWRNSEGVMIKMPHLNALNRQTLAHLFLTDHLKATDFSQLAQKGFTIPKGLTWEVFEAEVAKHIDLRLPLHYWGILHQTETCSRARARESYRGISQLEGMTFSYRLNYILDLRYVEKQHAIQQAKACKQQLDRLKGLAYQKGLMLKRQLFEQEDVLALIKALQHNQLTDYQRQVYFHTHDLQNSQATCEFEEFYI